MFLFYFHDRKGKSVKMGINCSTHLQLVPGPATDAKPHTKKENKPGCARRIGLEDMEGSATIMCASDVLGKGPYKYPLI